MTASVDVLGSNAQGRLRSIVERIERLEEDKAAVANDIKEVFGEAKGEGYDVKILRRVVRLRKQDKAKRQEEEALLDLYLSAIEGTSEPEGAWRDLQGMAVADQTKITIDFPGHEPIHTTSAQLSAALDENELYAKAVEIVRRDLKASTSYVQRRLQLGYNRAAALIERMEREGVVSGPDHNGKREVLRSAA
jgi:uncharacterized protein (UPF0335 family)